MGVSSFSLQPPRNTLCSYLHAKRNLLLSLPLPLPRAERGQPLRSLSPASDWNLHCLWHTRMRAQQGEWRPRGALKQEEGPAGVWLGSLFTALSGQIGLPEGGSWSCLTTHSSRDHAGHPGSPPHSHHRYRLGGSLPPPTLAARTVEPTRCCPGRRRRRVQSTP